MKFFRAMGSRNLNLSCKYWLLRKDIVSCDFYINNLFVTFTSRRPFLFFDACLSHIKFLQKKGLSTKCTLFFSSFFSYYFSWQNDCWSSFRAMGEKGREDWNLMKWPVKRELRQLESVSKKIRIFREIIFT